MISIWLPIAGTNLLNLVTLWSTQVCTYCELSQKLYATAQTHILPPPSAFFLECDYGIQLASYKNQVFSWICPDWSHHSLGEMLHWTSAFILPVVSDQTYHMLAVYIVKVIKHLRRSPLKQQPASLASNRVASQKIPAPPWLMNSINAFIKVFWRPENIQQLPKYAL